MKNIFLAILLVLCVAAYGQKETIYTAKEVEQKLENQKIGLKQEAQEDKVVIQDKRLDDKIEAQDKRINEAQGHLSTFIAIISIGSGLLLAATVLGGYLIFRFNKKTIRKVKKELKNLKTETSEEVKTIKENADSTVKLALLMVDTKIKEIESLLEKAKIHVDSIQHLESNAKNIVETIIENKDGSENKEIKAETKRTVEEINEKLPVNKYSFFDWFLNGYNASQKGLYEDAIFYFRKATESNNFKDESIQNKAITYNNWGNALFDLANSEKDKKFFEEAIVKYEKATQIDPNYPDAYNNWGSALSELAKLKNDENLFEASLEKYQKATQIDPNYADAYYNWGNALYDLAKLKNEEKFYETSLEKYEKATQINENDADAYYNWGSALYDLAKLRESIEDDQSIILEKFVKAYSLNETVSLYNLACLYSLLNKKDEAFEWLEKALQTTREAKENAQKDTDLDNLRQDPRFKELLNKYQC
ncbi:tetratricopeptide repeat protein [Dysgonomonas sp.]|uniref:tetratricopeptide repeat protein n=1 Tax=Dysgonomonas sp. TaxID=1891233 RepID=UPI0027BADE4C|nr:tetratricopeptide repeat protein [Dysgonomonas sp.]